MVLRHRAARARRALRPADPRGAGGLVRRPGQPGGRRHAPRSTTCAGSCGCGAALAAGRLPLAGRARADRPAPGRGGAVLGQAAAVRRRRGGQHGRCTWACSPGSRPRCPRRRPPTCWRCWWPPWPTPPPTGAGRSASAGGRACGRHHLQALTVFGLTWAMSSLALLLVGSRHRDPGAALQTVAIAVANLAATVVRFVAMRRWIFNGGQRFRRDRDRSRGSTGAGGRRTATGLGGASERLTSGAGGGNAAGTSRVIPGTVRCAHAAPGWRRSSARDARAPSCGRRGARLRPPQHGRRRPARRRLAPDRLAGPERLPEHPARDPGSACWRRSACWATGATPPPGPWSPTGPGRIGVITADISHFGPASTMLGIEAAARAAGYFVSSSTLAEITPRRRCAAAVEQVLEQAVEALVVIVAHRRGPAARPSRCTSTSRSWWSRATCPRCPLTAGVRPGRGRPAGHPAPARPGPRDGRPRRRARGLARGRGPRARAGAPRCRTGPAACPSCWRGRLDLAQRLRGRPLAARGARHHRGVRGQRPDGPRRAARAGRGRAAGPRGRQRRRLRRPARGGVLHPAADHGAPGLRRARPTGDRADPAVLAGEPEASVPLVEPTLVVRSTAAPRPRTPRRLRERAAAGAGRSRRPRAVTSAPEALTRAMLALTLTVVSAHTTAASRRHRKALR